MTCSCGETKSHTVARRVNADGIAVLLWDDGGVSSALGYALRGVPMRRPRTAEARALALTAGRLLMGEVCLWGSDDMGRLYAACERVAKRNGLPGDVRAEMKREAPVRPFWRTLSADRGGRPTERVWVLPRIMWPGLAVFDYVNSSRGRYEVANEVHSGTYETTGFRFHSLSDLTTWLMSARSTSSEVAS